MAELSKGLRPSVKFSKGLCPWADLGLDLERKDGDMTAAPDSGTEADTLDGAPGNGEGLKGAREAAFLEMQQKVEGRNVSSQTLLATDYLNHFNEIVMTLEMIPDMPELLEEAKAWQPKTYKDHFRDSTIADRELAIEAYDYVPTRYRRPFEKTIVQMSRLVVSSIQRLEKDLSEGHNELLRENAVALSRLLQRLIDQASAIIHGSQNTMDQGEIDAIMGPGSDGGFGAGAGVTSPAPAEKPAEEGPAMSQDDIDSLFG
ncbi:MAG: hypothetical protein ACPGOV_04405 [Magnetovibrionaceae bacterium]